MKTVGRTIKYRKGFTDELNKFFQLAAEFRKKKVFIPRGVFRFKTFEEADKWHHRVLMGKYPDHQR
jgi:hypothetical protein